jgi:hypothetical protein
MRCSKASRRIVLRAPLLATLALFAPASSLGRAVTPRASTGAALHILAGSAQLTGVVTPNGTEASFYFQYGTSTAYGAQTPTQAIPAGTAKAKVGAPVTGLLPGALYHYRLVATDTLGAVVPGHDHVFSVKVTPLKFEFTPGTQAVVGLPFLLSGTLRGFGNAGRQVILQATGFPYLTPFAPIGPPALTDANGRFSFRVANLASSTDFRVLTTDLRALYSPIFNVKAAARVTLHARSSGRTGLVRLYGTVAPAEVGAKLFIQLHKSITHPGSAETNEKFVSAFTTKVKKAGRTFSRFSVVVKVLHTGRYRALVRIGHGAPVVSGASATVVLHAPPGAGKRGR